jgi:hypothetical protein
LLILTGTLATSGAALARGLSLPKTSPEALKVACDKAGGQLSQDAKSYGCGTNCKGGPGTDCIVHCFPDNKKCTAQVIGARRPHSVVQALTKGHRR